MKSYLFLIIAIVLETIATSSLKGSEQFSKPIPSIITVLGYAGAFYFLSLTLKTIPVGIAYAIWSGVGIILITLVGIFAFKQVPDLPAILGLLLIIAGVIVINVFFSMSAH
ncbi:MAG TPA: multidrug efflux SMR transporter [Sphingobacteriaceae bacterium]|nr:multidrug efflux SMR transporter [Sphingobacteriaceae bacterium]